MTLFSRALLASLVLGILFAANAQTPVTASFNGQSGQVLAITGAAPLYNPDGSIIPGGKCVQSIVNSAATTGQWSLNYSALGFTSITKWGAQSLNPTGTALTSLTSQYVASVNSASTTAAAGTVMNANALGAVIFGTSVVQVSVSVCGGTS